MKRVDVDKYQRVRSQLEAFHREFEGLAKKAANSALNVFKLKIVNQAIAGANTVLGDAFLPIRGFSQFFGCMATNTQTHLYNTTRPLLDALYREMQELVKKKPDTTLSESKVKLINRLLTKSDMRVSQHILTAIAHR